MYFTELNPSVKKFFKLSFMDRDIPNNETMNCTTHPKSDYPAVYQGFATINRVPYLYSLDLNWDAFACSAGSSSGSKVGLIRR